MTDMLANSEKIYIQQHYQNLVNHWPNFRSRPAQKIMMEKIAEVFSQSLTDQTIRHLLDGRNILIVEGPAGVGKSLAYLVAGSALAKLRGKKLLISTATIALQEQLIGKDLPFIFKYSQQPVSYLLAKGRGHYLCPYRLYQYTLQPIQTTLPDIESLSPLWDQKLKPVDIALLHQLANAFHQRTWCGDIDEWPQTIESSLLSRITNDRHGCRKNTCPYRTECPFFLARDLLKKTDIIVVNHDLLLADSAMGGGVILPSLENSFYCIDEAHHLYKKAINQFSAEHALKQSINTLEKITSILPSIMPYVKNTDTDTIRNLAKTSIEHLNGLMFILSNTADLASYWDEAESMWLFDEGILPDILQQASQNLALLLPQLFKALSHLADLVEHEKMQISKPLLNKIADELGFLLSYIARMKTLWQLFNTPYEATQKPIAKWITYKNDFWFCAAPTDVSENLLQTLWLRASGALLTSATLRALGKFDALLQQTGLQKLSKVSCVALKSPFDFANQGELYIPAMIASPKNVSAHTDEIIHFLPKLIEVNEAVGTLVLFSSQKQMRAVAEKLDDSLKLYLLTQGDMTKSHLLATHEESLSSLKKPSIIFGLDSFAEGLDLPGKSCVHVIIAKLPFAMPNNPIDRTLSRWISKQGGNPFLEIAVPEASIKLLQAIGRLLRTETDYGRITILDHRLTTQFYGKQLLATLPPFKRIEA